jgi:predicted transcriptional regulator
MGRPKSDRPRSNRSFRLPDDLYEALTELARIQRRPASTVLEIALETHLAKHKAWPPPEPAAKKK